MEELKSSLHTSVFLGKTEQVVTILEGCDKLMLVDLLDCTKCLKCPLETAILRGHFDIADILVSIMSALSPDKPMRDVMMRWDYPILFNMIWKGDKNATKYVLDVIVRCEGLSGYHEIEYFNMTAMKYAMEHQLRHMVRFLRDDLSWNDDTIKSGCSSAFESSQSLSDAISSDDPIHRRDTGSTSGSSPVTPSASGDLTSSIH